VIGAKVQGISPEFIEAARKHGFQNLTIDNSLSSNTWEFWTARDI